MDKRNWIIIILVAALIAVCIFLYKGCNENGVPSQDKKVIDSLGKVIEGSQLAANKTIDSISSTNQLYSEYIDQAESENQVLTDSLFSIKTRVRKLQTDLASKRQDTIGLIDPSCLSLSEDFDKYIITSDKKDSTLDSIIASQKQVIRNDSVSTGTLVWYTTKLKQSYGIMNDKYAGILKNYGAQNKSLTWFKVKEKGYWLVIATIAGGLIFKK